MNRVKVFQFVVGKYFSLSEMNNSIEEWQNEVGANVISVDTKVIDGHGVITVIYNTITRREKLTEKIN